MASCLDDENKLPKLQSTQPTSGGEVTTGLADCCANGIENPCSQLWDPIYRFGAIRQCGPPGWMPVHLLKNRPYRDKSKCDNLIKTSLDLQYRPQKMYDRKPISMRCNGIEHWVHLRYIYQPSTIYRYLDPPSKQMIQTHNSHRHNTTPPFQTLVQTTYPLHTYSTHTTATQTKTQVQQDW